MSELTNKYPCKCIVCGKFLGYLTNEDFQGRSGRCDSEECLDTLTWQPDSYYMAGYAYACGYRD